MNDQTANTLYNSYNSKTPNDKTIIVTDQFDQQKWQQDPVTQAILNIVGTPDPSGCSTNNASSSTTPCLSSYQVMLTALGNVLNKDGELPGEFDYTNYDTNTSKFVSQLNSNNLLA